MASLHVYPTAQDAAQAVADATLEILNDAISRKGRAVWVLAGGSSPMAAYKILAGDFGAKLEWSKVTVVMGDERHVPFDDEDSNWGSIMQVFEGSAHLRQVKTIPPKILESVKSSASAYEDALRSANCEFFDVIWLGVGEDGHTLSLFPGHAEMEDASGRFVLPVLDSPKPPAERMTLSVAAVGKSEHVLVFAIGAGKQAALANARNGDALPIAKVAEQAEHSGSKVAWYYDEAAFGSA